jgi:glycosyltransferase involved in cell wall biosynthesis
VTIPTKNSAETLSECIGSVLREPVITQLIVADDRSDDGTQELARSLGAVVLEGPLPLLEARYQAFKRSSADAVILLDSDQIVEPGSLGRCVEMLHLYDALVLEETSVDQTTWLGNLQRADRRYLHTLGAHHMDPQKGSLLPRAFRRPILDAAFSAIPEEVRMTAVAQDHAIIYAEVAKRTNSIGFLPEGLRHREMERLSTLWRKYYRWGGGLVDLFEVAPEYRSLTREKMKGRLRRGRASGSDYVRSIILMALKTIPYSLGYAGALISRRVGGRTAV